MQAEYQDKLTQKKPKKQSRSSMYIPNDKKNALSSHTFDCSSRHTARRQEWGDIVQLLRLRLNDDPKDNKQFERLRQVTVSPPDTQQASNRSAERGLQQATTPTVEDRGFFKHILDKWNRVSEYDTGANKSMLEPNEDIIFEGHGTNIGMEDYTPDVLAEKAAEIILVCGYTARNPWSGRLVLLGCETGQFAEQTANSLQGRVHFPVTVIGTKHDIRVIQSPNGTLYAADLWEAHDAHAPANLTEIIEFYKFSKKYFNLIFATVQWSKASFMSLRKLNDQLIKNPKSIEADLLKQKLALYDFCNKLDAFVPPPRPEYIDFTQKILPTQTDHYINPISENKISITIPSNAAQLKAELRTALYTLAHTINDLINDIQHFDPLDPYSLYGKFTTFANQTVDLLAAVDKTFNCSKAMFTAFQIASHRRIDFQDPEHIVSATSGGTGASR